MVKKSSKGLIGAIAVALATSGAPAFAENADNIGNNRKCDYGAISGWVNNMAHGLAADDFSDKIAVKVNDGGVVKYSPSSGLCEYSGKPYGTQMGLVGIVTENGVPVPQYSSKGLQAVDANMTTAYVVTGLILAVSLAAYASVAKGSAATTAGLVCPPGTVPNPFGPGCI